MSSIQELVRAQIEKCKGYVENNIKTNSEAKNYCFGYLDALCESDDDYDELSREIDDTFSKEDKYSEYLSIHSEFMCRLEHINDMIPSTYDTITEFEYDDIGSIVIRTEGYWRDGTRDSESYTIPERYLYMSDDDIRKDISETQRKLKEIQAKLEAERKEREKEEQHKRDLAEYERLKSKLGV